MAYEQDVLQNCLIFSSDEEDDLFSNNKLCILIDHLILEDEKQEQSLKKKYFKSKKKVSFSPETKLHDGVSIIKKLFDESLIDGMIKRKFNNSTEYINYIGKDNLKYLKDIYKLLNDIIIKIQIKIIKNPEGLVPILPGGGGSCVKLGEDSIPWLIWFKQLIEYNLNQNQNKQNQKPKCE